MNNVQTTLAALSAAALLAAGCQSAPAPAGAAAGSPATTTVAPAEPAAPPPAAAPVPAVQGSAPEARAPEAPAAAMTTQEMQKRLLELGYQPGPADGLSGPRTVNALKKFQHDQKLPVTGHLDAETAVRLQQAK